MDQRSIIQNIWIILAIWSFLYIADYYFTIILAKKFQERLREYIVHEGSFELTPQFEKDVDNLRRISPRFIIYWLMSSVWLYVLWWLSNNLGLSQIFYCVLGALTLREGAVHLRHLRNWAMYTSYKKGAMKGKIGYSRWLILKLSAWELFGFGLLYLFLAIIESSWFFFGGVLGCWIEALRHRNLSIKASRVSENTQTMVDNSC